MAVYKVPQDVEADDKLIGPFSFRQFIYLIVVAISMAGAWGLSQLFIPLAIIPLPFIVFFAALALPLRKDQPMEAYLSAVVSFYFLKSRKRFWVPDGIASFVTIIPPKDAERVLTKELDETEATRRLEYLSNLVDSHGWAIRGAGGTPDTSISTDLYFESRNPQQTPDMMDNTTAEAQELTKKLDVEAG
ncbi:PrgI family protein, partial [Candidatus Saccharibacteria bacterium]|nr:PrgI family protein [Candidatus Saccharibacteria bacterium]